MWQEKLRYFLRRYLFLPNGVCPVCGKILFRTESFLCERCFEDLPRVEMRTCQYCGKPIFSETLRFCGDCGTQRNIIFDGGYVWLHYYSAGQRLIYALKFGHQPLLGIWMGKQMAEGIAQCDWIDSIEAILPVPLHNNRMEDRGYNQSEKLAVGIQVGLLEGGRKIPILKDTLIRCLDTPHQVGLDREERLRNLDGAFGVAEPDAVGGKILLLVDDVNTTGTTLRECAKTLKRKGAQQVFIATSTAAQ